MSRSSYERVMDRTRRDGECLVFTGCRRAAGYGLVGASPRKNGTKGNVSVHRVVWEHHHGSIPKELCVCHHCDNPPCVEITHLFTGTPTENMRDAMNKRRLAAGERNGQTHLAESDVQRIRRLVRAGSTLRSVARQYGVCHKTILNIATRATWKYT